MSVQITEWLEVAAKVMFPWIAIRLLPREARAS